MRLRERFRVTVPIVTVFEGVTVPVVVSVLVTSIVGSVVSVDVSVRVWTASDIDGDGDRVIVSVNE